MYAAVLASLTTAYKCVCGKETESYEALKFHLRRGKCVSKPGLLQPAMTTYTNIRDLKWAMKHVEHLDTNWLVDFFATLSPDKILQCLEVMLVSNVKQNLPICVRVVSKYYEQLSTALQVLQNT